MLIFFLPLSLSFDFSSELSLNALSTQSPDPLCKEIKIGRTRIDECLTESPDSFLLSRCPATQECRFSLKHPKPTSCSAVSPKAKNESHHLVPETFPCSSSIDCVFGLFCASVTLNETYTENQCLERSMYECSHLDQCIYGYVCNNSICISSFYIQPGLPADSRIACSSGLIKDGICQNPVKTAGKLPKPCKSNDDCLADDQVTQGVCSCLGPAGSFCELHESDNLSLNFLQASFESRIDDAEALFARIYYFPVYELTFEWPEEYQHAEELDAIYHNWSSLLSIALLMLVV